jgi:hypothetical protein
MHAARAFLVLRTCTQPAHFYFCVYTQVIFSALTTTVTSIRSRRARKYVLYPCAHTHTFAPPTPPAPAASRGSPLRVLGVGWSVPESLILRAISPRLPELKIRTVAKVRCVKARPVAQEYQPDPLHRE